MDRQGIRLPQQQDLHSISDEDGTYSRQYGQEYFLRAMC